MNPTDAIGALRDRSHEIARTVTAMHPAVKSLPESDSRTEILRALFELTKQVELVKKHLLKLEKQDNSTVL